MEVFLNAGWAFALFHGGMVIKAASTAAKVAKGLSSALKGVAAVEGIAIKNITSTFDLSILIMADSYYKSDNGFVLRETPLFYAAPKSTSAKLQSLADLTLVEVLPLSSLEGAT